MKTGGWVQRCWWDVESTQDFLKLFSRFGKESRGRGGNRHFRGQINIYRPSMLQTNKHTHTHTHPDTRTNFLLWWYEVCALLYVCVCSANVPWQKGKPWCIVTVSALSRNQSQVTRHLSAAWRSSCAPQSHIVLGPISTSTASVSAPGCERIRQKLNIPARDCASGLNE